MTAPTPVKALTIQQPWSWAIATGTKRVENRTWSTTYRGPLINHAGRTVDTAAFRVRLIRDLAHREALAAALPPTQTVERFHRLLSPLGHMTGVFLSVADLLDVHPDTGSCCDQWAQRSVVIGKTVYHWVLDEPRPLAPLPARGHQRLWTPRLSEIL